MLPRKNRLVSRKDFARLFSRGKSFGAIGLAMKVVRNGLGVTRVGFVVSTKVSKKAVVRNRLKRWMRETVRGAIDALPSGLDIVFIMRPEAAKFGHRDVTKSIGDALRKARLTTNS